MSKRILTFVLPVLVCTVSMVFGQQNQLEKGIQLALAGKYEEAKKVYEEILKADERDAAAHYRFGLLLLRRFQNEDDAVDHIQRAIELTPDNADYYMALGQAYGEKARKASIFKQPFLAPKVKSAFEKAAQIDPKHAGAHIGLAQYYSQAPGIMGGDMDKAWKEVDIVIGLNEFEGHRLKAQILEREKNINGAEQEWKLFAKLRPKDWRVWKLAGYFYLRQKKTESSLAAFSKYIDLRPDTADSYDSFAEALIQKNDYDKAETNLKKALAIDKNFKYSIERLAQVYELKGQKEEARDAYRRYLALEQDEAKRKLTAEKIRSLQ